MTCGRWKRYILVISQTAREKSRHEGTDSEADANPLTLVRTIHGSCCGLWSTQCEKVFSSQSRNGHLEIVRRNREETVRTLAVATPDLLNERMI
jgi:hypothetical protein